MLKATEEPLARLACRIAECADRNRSVIITDALRAVSSSLESHWLTLQRQVRRVGKAVDRGWFMAARRELDTGRFDRNEWPPLWQKFCRAVDDFQQHGGTDLTAMRLHEELRALVDEFDAVDWSNEHLWVNTEPIELEGVYLGRFQIRLRLDCIGALATSDDDFEVVALDPNPAGNHDEVTHPHVSGGRLCQGDATGPIRRALQQARLVDFFQVVCSVLRTYNAASPFVSLDEWEGVRCGDCGAGMSPEEASHCESCGDTCCDECYSCCQNCDTVRCAACLTDCHGCGDGHCGSCLSACEACGTSGFCEGCLAKCQQCEREGLCDSCLAECEACGRREFCAECLENDLCKSCHDDAMQEDDDVNDDEASHEWEAAETGADQAAQLPTVRADQAGAGVHPDGLVETAVPVPSG